MSKETWKEKIIFTEGGELAWVDFLELLTKKGIDHDGHKPIYIKFPEWEGEPTDYIEVSNVPIIEQRKAKKRMLKYKATSANCSPIVTVIAENEEDAKTQILETLGKVGREDYLEAWVVGGYRMEEAEIVKGDHFGGMNKDLFNKEEK